MGVRMQKNDVFSAVLSHFITRVYFILFQLFYKFYTCFTSKYTMRVGAFFSCRESGEWVWRPRILCVSLCPDPVETGRGSHLASKLRVSVRVGILLCCLHVILFVRNKTPRYSSQVYFIYMALSHKSLKELQSAYRTTASILRPWICTRKIL